MNPLLQSFLTTLVRHGLTVVGGSAYATDTNVGHVVGALLILGNLGYQWYQKHQADKAKGITVKIAA